MMTEKKEITLNLNNIKRNFKLIVLSLFISFCLLLILALCGKINPIDSRNLDSSDITYFGILSKEGYSDFNNDGAGESIQVHHGYTYDDPNIPIEQQTWHQPEENEQWSIPETFFSKAKKSAEVTFFDKLLVIYLPLIISHNFFIWIITSVIIFFLIRLKYKYRLKVE